MDNMIDEILVKELGNIGANSAAIGGAIGGGFFGALGGSSGGRIGAERSARKLKTYSCNDVIEYSLPIADCVNKCHSIVDNMPNLWRFVSLISYNSPYLAAVVGGGKCRMNPTIIILEFTPIDDISTKIQISAFAKEGLIKQHSAEKSIEQLNELLE